jgi:hypothetical protein
MRGSRPGERRGGRQKGTPNKKTAFRNAVIAARSANENLTPLDVMLAVIRDPQVSLADRVKMALKALPRLHRKPKAGQSGNAIAGSRAATVQSFGTPKDAAGGGTGKDAAATKRDPIGGAGKKGPTASSTPPPEESQKSTAGAEEGGKCPGLMPLDFLLSVIRHPKTPAALQVKVSLATLPYIHPKQSSRPPKPAVVADRYGFEVDPALAKKLRNKIARLAQLNRRRSPHPGDQKTIQRLHQEANLMIAALQCPCPSRYNDKAPANDRQRLERLWRKRRSRAKLTPAEDGELARLNARYMAFASGPEARARARIDALRDKDRRFRNGTGPRLGRCERAELRGLATLYPREIPEIDEEFLVRESVFSERPLDFEEPSDFQEFLTDQAEHDAAMIEMLAQRKAVTTP